MMLRTVIFFAMLLLPLSVFAATEAEIVQLRGQTELEGATVRLSDVFTGVPTAIDREIATAPQPGKTVVYDARILGRLAEKYRLAWQPQSPSDRAVLKRAATVITSEMIQQDIARKLNESGVKGRATIQLDKRDAAIFLPADQTPDFTLNNFNYDGSVKRFRVDLTANYAGMPIQRQITGRVSMMRDVPVLLRRLPAGSIISADDLSITEMPEERIQRDIVTELSQLVGTEVRQDLAEGEVVRSRDIMSPRFVMRGNLVTLKIQTPFMQITAQGKAMQNGGKGEIVRVTNTQSNRVVEGIVEAPGIVRVLSAGKTTSG